MVSVMLYPCILCVVNVVNGSVCPVCCVFMIYTICNAPYNTIL